MLARPVGRTAHVFTKVIQFTFWVRLLGPLPPTREPGAMHFFPPFAGPPSFPSLLASLTSPLQLQMLFQHCSLEESMFGHQDSSHPLCPQEAASIVPSKATDY